MKLHELSEAIAFCMQQPRNHDLDVVIVVKRPNAIGSTPVVEVASLMTGFDWDKGRLLLYPERDLTEVTPALADK